MVPYMRRLTYESPAAIGLINCTCVGTGGWRCRMIDDRTFYESLVESLKVLGRPNVELVIQALEAGHVICNGKVDRQKLEPALRSIFGDGAKVFLEFIKNANTIH